MPKSSTWCLRWLAPRRTTIEVIVMTETVDVMAPPRETESEIATGLPAIAETVTTMDTTMDVVLTAYRMEGCITDLRDPTQGITEEIGTTTTGRDAANTAKRSDVQSNSMSVNTQRIEELQSLAETTEDIHQVELGAMKWAPYSFENESRKLRAPKRKKAKRKEHTHISPILGDPTLDRIIHLLCLGLPYPSNDPITAYQTDRFLVYCVIDGYCIIDDEDNEEYILPLELAYNQWVDLPDQDICLHTTQGKP
ncbi:hypothetical protein NMY22_g16149 [Coprinellus aureogranulatus]|nr:hypothetical protein NMY22_g16149 [Coprinellus aureogranulatus]